MRKIDPELQARLDAGATTLCRCWRVTRPDGVVLGFTDHDETLSFDGTIFAASTGLDASALQTSNGLSVDNAQAVGALSDAAITEDDLRAGRYDGAEVDHWLVDWTKPSLRVHMFRGTLGEIRRTESSFEAELRGLTEALNVPVGRTIKRTCDRVIGDAKCGVDLARPEFRLQSEVAAETKGARIVGMTVGSSAEGWFTGGVLRWLTGRNANLSATIREDRVRNGRREFLLFSEPALPVEPGDEFRATAGCDKRAETCRAKFGNFLNFRGFPHIPGEDWVVAYPRSGDVHDGSSLDRS